MNEQKVFDKVATHLLTQGRRSAKKKKVDGADKPMCLYRGPNGTMCAVGCLIKDKYYSPKLENQPADWNDVTDALTKSVKGFTGMSSQRSFMSGLQSIHDESHPNQWKKMLKAFAEDYGLNTKVLEKF